MFIQQLKTVYGCNNSVEFYRYMGKVHRISDNLCGYHIITNRNIYDITDKIKTIKGRDNITPATSLNLLLDNMGVKYYG